MPQRRISDETANTLTHGLGLVLGLTGLPFLIVMAARYGNAWHIVSCSIFSATVISLYAASTLYHFVRAPRWKNPLRVVDHACIYLLIAGTYTPFTLVLMGNGWGWSIFGVVWGLAAVGVAFKVLWTGRFEFFSTATYIAMGWIALIAAYPILNRFPLGCILWLVAGGLCYTGGVVFYALDRRPYMHAAWHLFVLAGSTCHYIAIIAYVLPTAAWV